MSPSPSQFILHCRCFATWGVLLLALQAHAACPPGQSEEYGSCSDCRAGQYQTVDDSGQNVCVDCPIMTFSANPGATQCQPCPAGKLTYYTGSSECESCMVGFVPIVSPDSNYPSCEMCPDGMYTPRQGTAPCQKCAGGSYIREQDDTMSCVKCPAGTAPVNATHPQRCYSDSVGLCCEACEPGTFTATAGTLTCQACPAGTYQPNRNSSACLPCPPGTYNDAPGAAACKATDIGFYQDKPGQSSQVPCPTGTVGLIRNGSTQAAACFPYTAGRYRFTEHQDKLSVLTIRSFGTNAAVQSLGADSQRVMESGSSTGCGGEVYSMETYYMCSRYPYIDGVLDKSVCSAQPTSGPGTSSCLTYSFYALANSTYAWVINANNTDTSVCLWSNGQDTARCQFVEKVESSVYLGEWIYLGGVQQAGGQPTTNTQGNVSAPASKSSGSPSAASSLPAPWRTMHQVLLSAAALSVAGLLRVL